VGSCRPRGLATRVERHDPIPLSVRAVCIPHVHGITLCGTRSVLAVDLAPFASDPCVGWELRGLYASHVCRVCARVCASERVCA
jgi:hypothetical protein